MSFEFEFTVFEFYLSLYAMEIFHRPGQIYSNFLSHGQVTWYMWQKICHSLQNIAIPYH